VIISDLVRAPRPNSKTPNTASVDARSAQSTTRPTAQLMLSTPTGRRPRVWPVGS